MKLKVFRLILPLLLGLIVGVGCKQEADVDKIFAGAGPQIRDAWNKARAYDAKNDYIRAAETYDSLSQFNLTREQARAVQDALDKMYLRLKQSALSGDRDAKKLMEAIEKNLKEDVKE